MCVFSPKVKTQDTPSYAPDPIAVADYTKPQAAGFGAGAEEEEGLGAGDATGKTKGKSSLKVQRDTSSNPFAISSLSNVKNKAK